MVGNTVLIRDEDGTGKLLAEFQIFLKSSVITLRDVITERVFQEVDAYLAESNEFSHELLSQEQPSFTLNHEQEVLKALKAFETNGFFILVNDRQVEDLDEIISLRDASAVTFVRLIPIVGG